MAKSILVCLLALICIQWPVMCHSSELVFKVREDALINGDGSESVSTLKAELPSNLRKALRKKGDEAIYENNVPYDVEIKLSVTVDYVKQFFNHFVVFKKVSASIEKDGKELGTIEREYDVKAGDYKTYGKEGEAFSLKVATELADLLKSADVVTQMVALKSGRSHETGQKHDNVESTSLVDVIGKLPKGRKAGKYDVAVIIGNRNYKKTSNVDFAVQDAMKMKELVTRTMGYPVENVLYTEDATLTDFTEIFGAQRGAANSKLNNYIKAGVSNVFIYYVGHGAPDIKAEKPEAYFVPVDADPQYLSESGYKVRSFYENIARLPAKSLTVVIDSCFSGNSPKGLLFKGISGLMVTEKLPELAVKNSVVLTSTSENQVSSWYEEKQHSLFTYFFIKGLQGDADVNRDRKITAGELNDYVSENVAGFAKRLTGNQQQPVMTGENARILAILE